MPVRSWPALTLALAGMLGTAPAHGGEGMLGIAFVQAPEAGAGVATGTSPEAAIEAAMAQCMQTTGAEDCIVTNWCQPAGWSVDLFVQHEAGPHWHEVVCGLPDRDMAENIAAQLCDLSGRDGLILCEMVQLYDDTGTPLLD